MKRRTLIDLIQHDLARDPGDAPALVLQDAIDLQDLRWMPETSEPPTAVAKVREWTAGSTARP